MRTKEKLIELLLAFCSFITILTTLGIIWVLASNAYGFFSEIPITEFLFDTQWTPLFSDKHFGILPLLSGTLLTTFIALLVAIPVGLSIAVYLSEYAPRKFRETIKPLLEVLAAVPTVVYGYFALFIVSPFLQQFFVDMGGFNALSAGIVMGIMIIPMVSSLSEDSLYAVPSGLKEAAYGMGSTRLQTSFRVLIPAASSGIVVSIILATARAIGETMIVTIAAGQQPNLTFDPRESVQTITAYIVQVSQGDVQHGTLEYTTIFAAGIALFVFTFILNNLSFWVRKKFYKKYE